jgi:hypothetical protein
MPTKPNPKPGKLKKGTIKKYRQARRDAKPAAKEAFPGKVKAVKKDALAKTSAEDRAILKEVTKESRGGYITTDKGEKVYTRPTETAAERFARDRREVKAQLDRKWAEEDAAEKGASKRTEKPAVKKVEPKIKPALQGLSQAEANAKPKESPTRNGKTPTKKAGVKKPAVKKAAPKPAASAYAKARAAGKTPAEAAKAANPKLFGDKKVETKQTGSKTFSVKEAENVGTKKTPVYRVTSKELVPVKKTSTELVRREAAKTAGKKLTAKGALVGAARLASKAVTGKVGLALTAASLVGGPIYKQLSKDTKGRTTWDVMNARAKAVADKAAADKKASMPKRPAGTYPKGGGKGLKFGPNVKINSGGATSTTINQGSTYTVDRGDNLSTIAKRAGVSLAEIKEANPSLMKKPKYKQGSVIFKGTKVKIPTKK